MSGMFDWNASFAGGILGPSLHGRVDLAKYKVGLKDALNVFIHPHGGASNRAGTEFIMSLGNVSARLVPFERDEVTSYVLAMRASQCNVIRDGAPILSGGTPYQFEHPFDAAAVKNLSYVQSVDVMFTAHNRYQPRKIMHAGPTSWSVAVISTHPKAATPAAPTVTPSATGTTGYEYRVSAVVDGVEGFASAAGVTTTAQDLNIEGARNVITWAALTTAPDQYRVYRLRGGIWGYIGFTDGAVTNLTDDNIEPKTDVTVRTPQDLLYGVGSFPSVVTLTQQRLVFGGSDNNPDQIMASVVGDYENFTKGAVIKADDRFKVSISGEKLNRITGLVGMQELVVFTGSGEYGVGTQQGYLSATEPRQVRYGAAGSVGVRPLLVGESVLYVDRSGRHVRDLIYSMERDGYAGSELSLFIPHLLEGRQIVDWAYCNAPHGIVWVVLDDGSVLSLTYKREQEVWAWSRHDFGAKVESVCSIWEGGEDRLYLAIRRGDNLYIERMSKRNIKDSPHDSNFCDSAVVYSGAETSTIGGLAHLDGQEVWAVADGDVYDGLTVSGGSVTLPRAVTKAYVGLFNKALIETLPLYMEVQGLGATRGVKTKATEAFVQMEKTRGVELSVGGQGPTSDMMQVFDPLNETIQLYTGLWSFKIAPQITTDPTIRIEQNHPLPMTILGVSPRWSVGNG